MNGPTLYSARHGVTCAILFSTLVATAPAATAQTLPHGVPDFCAAHTITSVASGAWSNPATWSRGRIPVAGDVVRIAGGTIVTYDVFADASIACVGVEGALRFRPDIDTRLRVGTLLVKPSGELTVGTAASPIASSARAEIVIANQPLNTSIDPSQYGTGLIGLGKVAMHGAAKTPTFTRIASEPRTGQTTLTLAGPVSGWRVGDRIVLPDTRQLTANERFAAIRPQFEEFTVAGLSGTQLTLNRGITYNHDGARNAQGVLELLPHIGNLSRNVVIRSDNPGGTRGHTMYIHQAAVDIRYVLFKDLGRTSNATLGPSNMMGRYPLHIHHVMGPVNPTNTGHQFTLIGNAIADSRKWPLTVHNSHYGLIRDNVVFNGEGAGFVTEDGNESYNEFVHNFGLAIFGDVAPRSQDGRDASVFWFHGFNHIVRDNVAANAVNHHQDIVNGSGFNFTWPAASKADTHVPLFRGADVTMAGEFRLVNMQLLPIPDFSGNEAYGAMPTGAVAWQLGTDGYQVPAAMGETIIRNFTGWHLHESAFFGYPTNNITLEGLVVRGHPRARGPNDGGSAWYSNDYKNRNVTIRRADIQGMSGGLQLSTATEGAVVIEDSYFSNWGGNISVDTLATPGTGATPLPRTLIVRNTRFDPMPGAPSFTTISMDWTTQRGNSHTQTSDRLFVYGYNGIAGSDFRVFYAQQASQNIAGGTATCTARRPEIDGLVCPITVRAPAPGALTPTVGPASGGTIVTITGSNFAAGARVEFGGIPATNVNVESATRITATTPSQSEGPATVSVTNSEGQRGFLVDAFNFGDNGNTPPCRYSLDSSAANVPASGGSRSVSVSAGSGCGWSAVSRDSWITVTAGSSGSGRGMVEFAVAANTATAARSGMLSIAGETFTVSQDGTNQGGPKCSFTVSPTALPIPASGGTASVNVSTTKNCSWTATSQTSWIEVTDNQQSDGSNVVIFKVAANTGNSTRTGTLTVAGQTVTVTQSAQAPPTSTGRAIGIDFVGSGTAMSPGEVAGVIAKTRWNAATGATRRTPLALADDRGTASGATVTWRADNVWSTPIVDQAGDRRLMKGYLDTGFGRATTITVAGLAPGAYDVYVYVDGDNGSASRTGVYQLSGAGITTTTVNLMDPAGTNFTGTFSQGNGSAGNYIKFSITARGFTLTATPGQASTGTIRAPVNGIQIVAR